MYFMKHVQETESYVNVQYSKIFQDLPRYSLTPRSLAKFSGSTWFDVLKFKGHLENSRAAEWLRLFGYRHYTKFCRKSADVSMCFFYRCVADWWFGTWVLFFHICIHIYIYIGDNHPNWRTHITDLHIFQRGRSTTNQVVIMQKPEQSLGIELILFVFGVPSPACPAHISACSRCVRRSLRWWIRHHEISQPEFSILPSGKHTKNYDGKSPFSMGKSTN